MVGVAGRSAAVWEEGEPLTPRRGRERGRQQRGGREGFGWGNRTVESCDRKGDCNIFLYYDYYYYYTIERGHMHTSKRPWDVNDCLGISTEDLLQMTWRVGGLANQYPPATVPPGRTSGRVGN
ncbi:hypothetical protein ACLOJK_014468 [Asimina triloba]